MSDTPETDEETRRRWNADGTCDYVVDADFACKLERERDEARRLAEKYRNLSCEDQDEADNTILPWENDKLRHSAPAENSNNTKNV